MLMKFLDKFFNYTNLPKARLIQHPENTTPIEFGGHWVHDELSGDSRWIQDAPITWVCLVCNKIDNRYEIVISRHKEQSYMDCFDCLSENEIARVVSLLQSFYEDLGYDIIIRRNI